MVSFVYFVYSSVFNRLETLTLKGKCLTVTEMVKRFRMKGIGLLRYVQIDEGSEKVQLDGGDDPWRV